MRYVALLLCFFYYHMLFKTKPVYADDSCPAGAISTEINSKFEFDRVDYFARSETTSTINTFPATANFSLCWKPGYEVWIRKSKTMDTFEVKFDRRGKQTAIVK